jgi:hypothetical protein
MSVLVAAVPMTDADLRWQRWQADGAARDRKRNARLKVLAVVVGIGFGVATLVQFL